ncbi:MAG TPA: isochorismatase family cysteine hydrolase [Pseudonocardiaceae bacterium]|jgi:nicotinamidase-related amidase|nr:isochorismatase family cysteine hydrolase [Pseudonocardiaceae bacterium]
MSQPWLTIIDMQRMFAEPDSEWFTPRFAEIIEPITKLLPAFGDRVVFTRFVAPELPTGAWRAYYDQWPAQLVAADHPMYEIVPELAPEPGAALLSATTFSKWTPELAGLVGAGGQLVLVGVATDCCVLSTAVAAADAGVSVRVVAEACAGANDDSHHKALDILSGYAPMVEVVELADILEVPV